MSTFREITRNTLQNPDLFSKKNHGMENIVVYKKRISTSLRSTLPQRNSRTKRKWGLKRTKMKDMGPPDNDSKDELVELINLAPKGPIYFYCKDKILGEGGYAKVLKGFAIKGKNKTPVAIKTGQLSDVKEFYKDDVLGDIPKEVFILKNLPKHPAAIQFLHYQKTSSTTYVIIMERPKRSKDLYNLRGETYFPFSEKKARKIIRDLGGLLMKMEKMRIVHRDIKPKNVVYDLDKNVVKLVDFGLACYFEDGKAFNTFHGTESYMPPECFLDGSYEARKETVWSLGILTYYLLTGCRPHDNAAQAVTQPYGPPTHLKNLSTDAKDLVEKMLSLHPNKRLSLKQVTKHPWLTGRRVSSLWKFMPSTIPKKLKLHHEMQPILKLS